MPKTSISVNFVARYPLFSAVILVGGAIVIDTLVGALIGKVFPGSSIQLIGFVTGIALSFVLAGLTTWLGWWRNIGFQKPKRWRALFWVSPFVLYGLFPLLAGISTSASTLVLGILAGLFIAFWKLMVLGLLFYIFLPLGKWRSILLGALFFALMHLGGLLVGVLVLPTLLNSLSYLLLAVAFLAFRQRTETLWPIVISYGLFLVSAFITAKSSAPNLAPDTAVLIFLIIISGVQALYGLLMLVVPQRGGGLEVR